MYLYETQRLAEPPRRRPSLSSPFRLFGSSWDFLAPRNEFRHHEEDPALPYWGERPQHFYLWLSPPGVVRAMECTVLLLSFTIFTCVASTMVWDMQYGYTAGVGGFGVAGGFGTAYYSGGHAQYMAYPSPYSAKVTMMAMATVAFLVSSTILVASFSRAHSFRGRCFYLLVVIVDSVLAFLQGIINITYVIGINPTSQSSQSMLYNPVLTMCQNMYAGSSGGGAALFPLHNQHLYHFCYMDPQEAVAMVCGFLLVLALALAACFAQKTRGKIWRHGKPNIYWERPLSKGPGSEAVNSWVPPIEGEPSVCASPMVLLSEKALSPQDTGTSLIFFMSRTDSTTSGGKSSNDSHVKMDNCRLGPTSVTTQGVGHRACSTPSEDPKVALPQRPLVQTPGPSESPYETGYASGAESGAEPDEQLWSSMFPEIISLDQRQAYKRAFDSDLRTYKSLCVHMDHVGTQLSQLESELKALQDGSPEHQALREEYTQLKELKKAPAYQAQKHQCRELQRKLCHIKRMVKNYDAAHVQGSQPA